jgi:hypothetical protein
LNLRIIQAAAAAGPGRYDRQAQNEAFLAAWEQGVMISVLAAWAGMPVQQLASRLERARRERRRRAGR